MGQKVDAAQTHKFWIPLVICPISSGRSGREMEVVVNFLLRAEMQHLIANRPERDFQVWAYEAITS